MQRSRLALLATPLLALAALGCEDLSRFSTSGDEAYCGAVVGGASFREGLSPRLAMSLTLDASHLDGPASPGAITTNEPGVDGGAAVNLFDDAPLRLIAPLEQDPLSHLVLGDGSERSAVYAVSPKDPKQGSMIAVISLMHDATVEVRLLRPGAAAGDNSDQSQIFGLFSLTRRESGCGF